MALTPSKMVGLGSPLPAFNLRDAHGQPISSEQFQGRPVLVAFICNHCPFVQHIAYAFSDFAQEYRDHGLEVVAINSNDATSHPDDSPEQMVEEARRRGYTFPYLVDETQKVARAFDAACTPDFFLYDRDHRLAYRGQFDASRPGQELPVTGKDLRAAADAVLSGEPPSPDQLPAVGCSIKWK
ncbi:thioredoxin family protein [Onishia taeanensis]